MVAVSILVAAIVILGLFVVPFAQSKIIVTVESDHLVNTIDYALYLDGELMAEGQLDAGSSDVITI